MSDDKDENKIRLNDEDFEAFEDALEASRAPSPALRKLLGECDPNEPIPEEAIAWLNAPPVGREII